MIDYRDYEILEEELDNETNTKPSKIKKKKTWKQINEENQRKIDKKQWQKKRRISKKDK
jgi:hypothetical protein